MLFLYATFTRIIHSNSPFWESGSVFYYCEHTKHVSIFLKKLIWYVVCAFILMLVSCTLIGCCSKLVELPWARCWAHLHQASGCGSQIKWKTHRYFGAEAHYCWFALSDMILLNSLTLVVSNQFFGGSCNDCF